MKLSAFVEASLSLSDVPLATNLVCLSFSQDTATEFVSRIQESTTCATRFRELNRKSNKSSIALGYFWGEMKLFLDENFELTA
jgi:hypothetical protein